MLSIITPFYNAELYIETGAIALFSQLEKYWEWIIINDASIDGSLAIVKGLQQEDKRIKIIDLKENKGQGYARNFALKKAKGDQGFLMM